MENGDKRFLVSLRADCVAHHINLLGFAIFFLPFLFVHLMIAQGVENAEEFLWLYILIGPASGLMLLCRISSSPT